MKRVPACVVLCLFLLATLWARAGDGHSVAERYLFAMANADRAQHGLPALHWDQALARAANEHARRMAADGSIAHQYNGETDLAARAQAAGARFSAVLENVGEASTAVLLHNAWMNSAHHRENLLDASVDGVGIGVVQRGGQLYAVEDFARSVAPLSLDAQEAAVSAVLARYGGLALRAGGTAARETCRLTQGYAGEQQPWFVMRYTTGDLGQVPEELMAKLRSGQFRQAAVGACSPAVSSPFSMYALAVLLYP